MSSLRNSYIGLFIFWGSRAIIYAVMLSILVEMFLAVLLLCTTVCGAVLLYILDDIPKEGVQVEGRITSARLTMTDIEE